MFRRKEEESNDGYQASAGTAQEPSTGAAKSGENAPSGAAQVQPLHQSQPAQSSPAASQPVAAPVVQPAVRPVADMARPAAAAGAPAAATPGYRPSPVTDFNRSPASPSPARPVGQTPSSSATVSHSFPSSADRQTTNTGGKTSPRILTVGNDILLKGEIATCDRVVIEGRVEAKLSDVHTVEIAGSGSFKGTAEVEDAEVSGLFEGDLAVRNRLVIYANGEVRGNITYGEIEIERGGKLTGQIKTVGGAATSGSSAAAASGSASSGEKPNLLDVLDAKSSRKEAGGHH
ncbi:MAG TPA: polymer-forming cytoskeletal protein [Rickettsiales bacterium]|nr:polymer-forming cytoskeletal protein [Rickettsiales bacterium]